MIDVNALLFKAVAEVQSKEETRYYLCGVYITKHPKGGALLVATDGHRMMVAHDQDGKCSESAIVKIDPKALAGVKAKLGKEPPRLTVAKDGAATLDTYRGADCILKDATFPDWARIPISIVANVKAKKSGAASFNGQYMAVFGKIAGILSHNKHAPIRPVAFSNEDPALILFPEMQNVFGVLMPMRTGDANAMPAFMQPVLEPKQKPRAA